MPAFFYVKEVSMKTTPVVIRRPRQPVRSEVEKLLLRLISGMEHGRVTLVLQDGVVIQVNREESVRLA